MGVGPEDVANELGALAKRVYDTGVIDTEQRLTITYDALPKKDWELRGDGWYGDAHLIRSSSYKFATATESLPQETTEESQQFLIRNKEMFGQVTFTKNFLMQMVGGKSSFEDYTFKVEDLIKTMKKNQNQACYIGPTMARTTLTASPSASTSLSVASTQYLHVGMYLDVYSGTGTTLVQSNFKITAISGTTLTVTPAVTATSGDTLYLHDENINSGSKGLTGLGNQCDDGTDYSVTFENLSRTTYPTWKGNRIDASSAPLTSDLLMKLQNLIYTNGGNEYMSEDYINFVHPDSVRRYIQIVLPQKRYVDASKYDAGFEKPNALEWNGREIKIDPDCVKTDWYMINRAYSGKMEIAPVSIDSTLNGSAMKWKNGYMQGVMVAYSSGQLGNSKPNSCGVLKNLAAVA